VSPQTLIEDTMKDSPQRNVKLQMIVKGPRAGYRFRLIGFILSGFLLFCLALSGCDMQGDPPGLLDDSPSVGEEAVSQGNGSHGPTPLRRHRVRFGKNENPEL
jgi:hypothetical protein